MEQSMYGYFNRIAIVDLSTGKVSYRSLEEKQWKMFVGGSGIGALLLHEYTDKDTDPLGPDNVLIFMTGPVTGTRVFSSDRFEVITKSPLTGIYAEADCGGRWGEMLKKCGIDGLILKGAAEKPSYLFVTDDGIQIRDAAHLRGKDTFETDEILRDETDSKARTVAIGPAGENLVRFACIIAGGEEGRAAGRAGVGTVMGSKKVKAIVALGTRKAEIADPDGLKDYIKNKAPTMVRMLTEELEFRQYGTSIGVEGQEVMGDLPIKNWYQGNWPEGAKKISGYALAGKYLTKNYHCGRCVIGCGRTVEVKEGPYKIEEAAGPEYENIAMLGSNLLVDDIGAICKANDLCNRYGLDAISTGALIGFAMEAYERGLITRQDTGGIDLVWGNGGAVVEMVEKIAYRKDLGRTLGEGILRAAETIGGNSIEFAVHVKGLDFPAHDPRAKVSDALGYVTSNRGACHLQAYTHDFENWYAMPDYGYPETMDRFDTSIRKVQMVIDFQHLMSMIDSIHVCKFVIFGGMTANPLIEVLNLVTGWDLDQDSFRCAGERIFTLKRLYNNKLGISRKDDVLPPRILLHPRGGTCGDFVPPLNAMLRDYYRIRGWTEFGIPSGETVEKLGLESYLPV